VIEITGLVAWNKMPDPQRSHYLLLDVMASGSTYRTRGNPVLDPDHSATVMLLGFAAPRPMVKTPTATPGLNAPIDVP